MNTSWKLACLVPRDFLSLCTKSVLPWSCYFWLSHRSDIGLNTQEHTSSFLPSYAFYAFPNTQLPGFRLPETGNAFIATDQTKTSPIFLHKTQDADSQFSRLFLEYSGSQRKKVENCTTLNNSPEKVLPPDFLLCQHKPVWNCLASCQKVWTPGLSAPPASDIQKNKEPDLLREPKILFFKSPAACWAFWGYWKNIEISSAAKTVAGITTCLERKLKLPSNSRCWGFKRY